MSAATPQMNHLAANAIADIRASMGILYVLAADGALDTACMTAALNRVEGNLAVLEAATAPPPGGGTVTLPVPPEGALPEGLIEELRAVRRALEALEAKILPFDVPVAARNFMSPTARDWVKSVLDFIAYQHGLSVADLTAPYRSAHVIRPRFIAIWVLRQCSRYSLPQIAAIMQRDHSSVLHACRQVDRWRASDEITREHTDALINHAAALRQQMLAPASQEEKEHASQI